MDGTPPKIYIEPKNDGLVQMIFLFQGAGKLSGEPAVNLQGVFWAVETKLFGFV